MIRDRRPDGTRHSDALAFEVDRYDTCAGIVNVRCRCGEYDGPLELAIWETGSDYRVRIPLADKTTLSRLLIFTHLFDNGTATFVGRLMREDTILAVGEFSIRIDNVGALREGVTAEMAAAGLPRITAGHCDSSMFPEAPHLRPWFDRVDDGEAAQFIGALEKKCLSDEQILQFHREGYIELPGFLSQDEVEGLLADLAQAEEVGFSGYTAGSSQRLTGLHRNYANFNRLFYSQALREPVEDLFQADAVPCQSLGYVFGSEQELHQDTVHLTPFPAGFMCGAWIALEDVQEDSGELFVLPGSHRFDRVMMKDVGCTKVVDDWREFEAKVVARWRDMRKAFPGEAKPYRPKAGSLLIWHENLMHGGGPRKNRELSRRSVVFHFFARGSLAYYDSSGAGGALAVD